MPREANPPTRIEFALYEVEYLVAHLVGRGRSEDVRELVVDEGLAWLRAHRKRRGWNGDVVDAGRVRGVIRRARELQFPTVDLSTSMPRHRSCRDGLQGLPLRAVGHTAAHDTIDDAAMAKAPGFLIHVG
jgi:hypothetical protein